MTMMINDSDKQNDPNNNHGTENFLESCDNDELEVGKTAGTKRSYSTKQKRVVVAYAKHHYDR